MSSKVPLKHGPLFGKELLCRWMRTNQLNILQKPGFLWSVKCRPDQTRPELDQGDSNTQKSWCFPAGHPKEWVFSRRSPAQLLSLCLCHTPRSRPLLSGHSHRTAGFWWLWSLSPGCSRGSCCSIATSAAPRGGWHPGLEPYRASLPRWEYPQSIPRASPEQPRRWRAGGCSLHEEDKCTIPKYSINSSLFLLLSCRVSEILMFHCSRLSESLCSSKGRAEILFSLCKGKLGHLCAF